MSAGIIIPMLKSSNIIARLIAVLAVIGLLLTACANNTDTPELETPETILESPTPEEPTATPVPAAAVVNGERIPLELFQNELERYLAAREAMGNEVADESEAGEFILNDLVDQMLLAQAARDAGDIVSDDMVQERLDALAEETDLAAWQVTWGYSDEDLFELLKLQVLAAHQRDRIIAAVPEEVEQVELRQVLAYTAEGADRAASLLNAGTPFEDVAREYDRRGTDGYLGWVPRGYLLIPAVEEAAFALDVGAYSEFIPSDVGYHIVMVLDRGERPLTRDARLALQRAALQDWISEQRENSQIEILVD